MKHKPRADDAAETNFPDFPYHPDPRATGVVVKSHARCRACGDKRGYIYTGPVYAIEQLEEAFCPWCIADGTAAAKFDAEFTNIWTGGGVPDDVPRNVTDYLARRTPGFPGWQEAHWLYHCGDGAAFLGIVGRKELEAYPDALETLRHEHDEYGWSTEEVEEHLAALDREGDPSAYLFRCRHCGSHLAYSDFLRTAESSLNRGSHPPFPDADNFQPHHRPGAVCPLMSHTVSLPVAGESVWIGEPTDWKLTAPTSGQSRSGGYGGIHPRE